MKFTKKPKSSKSEIQQNFLVFFKIQDVKHLVAQKIKELKQKLCNLIIEYDKRCKYLLSQIPYRIEEQLLIQWFVGWIT